MIFLIFHIPLPHHKSAFRDNWGKYRSIHIMKQRAQKMLNDPFRVASLRYFFNQIFIRQGGSDTQVLNRVESVCQKNCTSLQIFFPSACSTFSLLTTTEMLKSGLRLGSGKTKYGMPTWNCWSRRRFYRKSNGHKQWIRELENSWPSFSVPRCITDGPAPLSGIKGKYY